MAFNRRTERFDPDEPGNIADPDLGLPGDAEPLLGEEPDEPTADVNDPADDPSGDEPDEPDEPGNKSGFLGLFKKG